MPFTPSGCRSGRATTTDLQPASPMPETSRTRSHRRGSFFMCPQVAGLDTQAWTAARVIHRHLFSRLVVMTTQAGLTSGRDRPQAPVGRPGSPINSEPKGARRPAPRGVDRPMHSGASWGRRQVKDHRMLELGARCPSRHTARLVARLEVSRRCPLACQTPAGWPIFTNEAWHITGLPCPAVIRRGHSGRPGSVEHGNFKLPRQGPGWTGGFSVASSGPQMSVQGRLFGSPPRRARRDNLGRRPARGCAGPGPLETAQ